MDSKQLECRNGKDCQFLKRGKCRYTHSKEDKKSASNIDDCKNGKECNYIKKGECRYQHPKCKNGPSCQYLQNLECQYAHEKQDYKQSKENVDIEQLKHSMISLLSVRLKIKDEEVNDNEQEEEKQNNLQELEDFIQAKEFFIVLQQLLKLSIDDANPVQSDLSFQFSKQLKMKALLEANEQDTNFQINPYKILDLPNECKDIPQIKKQFRQKITSQTEEKFSLYDRKNISLAYQALQKGYYKLIKTLDTKTNKYTYSVPQENQQYHYTITGDIIKLSLLISQKPELVKQKDDQGRTLLYLAARNGFNHLVRYLIEKGSDLDAVQCDGSTALHTASFYGHLDIIQTLLLNGANHKIKNRFNSTAQDEAYNDSIKQFFKNNKEIMEINKTLTDLKSQQLVKCAYQIVSPDQTQAGIFVQANYLKLPQSNQIVLAEFAKKSENFIIAYHGTTPESITSILQKGFVRPSKRGAKVLDNHIQLGREYNGIKDWADALFFSQSIFYSHNYCSKKMCDKFSVIFQVVIKKNSYTEHKHTIGSYDQREGEPDTVEFRVGANKDGQGKGSESDIGIMGFYLVGKEFIDQLGWTQSKLIYSEFHKNQFSQVQRKLNEFCLLGHALNKCQEQGKHTLCDVCGQSKQLSDFYQCSICKFDRCQQCYNDEKII